MSLKNAKKGLQEGLLSPNDIDIERNNTFGTTNNDFSRKSTFSRALTFTDEVYNKTVSGLSAPLEGLQRKFTEVGNMIDPDAKMTKAMLQDIEKIAEQGPEGDMPLPDGFAHERMFWRLLFWNAVVACIMGLIGAAFMNVADEVNFSYIISSIYQFPHTIVYRFLNIGRRVIIALMSRVVNGTTEKNISC
jgi:hypothetical protein